MWVFLLSSLFFLLSFSVEKQSQLLLQPTNAELGLQVGVTFDNKIVSFNINSINVCGLDYILEVPTIK